MGDPLGSSDSARSAEVKAVVSSKKFYRRNAGASGPKEFPQSAYRHITSLSHSKNGCGAVGHAAIFLLKVAALETVRRVSRSKCPFVWRGLQALQFICYPPLKWIQRWAPFKGLINGVQMFSRPLLVLSIATAFCGELDCNTETVNGADGSHAHSETHSGSPSIHLSRDARTSGEAPPYVASENWLMQLHNELDIQGISLPERINEDELRRFFTAANGDFSYLLSSVKKTIRWRETYVILSEQELEMWSSLVFWHGFDVENRPCLIVRLGLACLKVPSHERPRFTQAVISQVEHGVLYLVNKDNPKITVLVDCDGITPLRIPMQMMRFCCSVLQENFPDRLGHLLVIRLPPVVRVIAQTFIQILKPVTRKKLRIEGNMYYRVLSEYLQALPLYLGGNCACKICSNVGIHVMQQPQTSNVINKTEPSDYGSDGADMASQRLAYHTNVNPNDNWDHLLRTAVIGILMAWVFVALIAGFYDR